MQACSKPCCKASQLWIASEGAVGPVRNRRPSATSTSSVGSSVDRRCAAAAQLKLFRVRDSELADVALVCKTVGRSFEVGLK